MHLCVEHLQDPQACSVDNTSMVTARLHFQTEENSFVSHGTFDRVEVHLENLHVEEQSDSLRGGWHTEASLTKEGWTPTPSCTGV